MIVVSLTNCPPRLRGDLTRWLMEVNTGVYVGNVSARVRDALWQRICEHVRDGRATMVFSTNNEQGMDFRVHNTTWIPTDFDGIQLMLRPSEAYVAQQAPIPPSRAAQIHKVQRIRTAQEKKFREQGYIVLDVETTGLRADQHDIIELAAMRVVEHEIADTFSTLVRIQMPLPATITALTGISEAMLREKGIPLSEAMAQFLAFVAERRVVCHHASFDYAFLKAACRKCHLPEFRNAYADTWQMAKRQLDDVPDYKLATLAAHLGIDTTRTHRALDDCRMTFLLFEKLNEKR
ncbi:MAG: type I-E CRISPR-associated endoribonuclease Cas2e [Aristaeellaceae bacterium]